ncbi:MAG: DUF2752 domain-containing protein [Chryseobacterium sp.]|nr:MAG: DUF2752 domain-containing protein [Chryseobacterium sp.]
MNLPQTIYKNQELKNAIRIVWQISAIASIALLLILFFADNTWILSAAPTCEYSAKGEECFLCGSTRAFTEIKNFNFKNALALNKLSILLFALMVINALVFANHLFKLIKTKL